MSKFPHPRPSSDGVIQSIRGVINPDKLSHLGPVADVRAMLRAARSDAEAR